MVSEIIFMKKLIVIFLLIPVFFLGIKSTNAYDTPIRNINYVVDETNTLSTSEISFLENEVIEIKKERNVAVHFLIASSINVDIVQYSNEYIYDIYNTYNEDVTLVVLADFYIFSTGSSRRHVEISNYGYAGKLISNSDVEDLLYSKAFDYFNGYKYYESLCEFAKLIDEELKSSILFYNIMPHVIIAGIATLITLLVIIFTVSSRGTRMTVSGRTYMEQGQGTILGRYDRYVRTTVTRVSRQSSSGGGGGGGGGGRSSGGGRSC